MRFVGKNCAQAAFSVSSYCRDSVYVIIRCLLRLCN